MYTIKVLPMWLIIKKKKGIEKQGYIDRIVYTYLAIHTQYTCIISLYNVELNGLFKICQQIHIPNN